MRACLEENVAQGFQRTHGTNVVVGRVLESCAKDVAHNVLVFGRFQGVAHRPIDGEWATVGAIELALLFFAERWIVLGYLAAARNGIAVVSGDFTLVVLRWAGEAARVEARALLAAAG